MSDALFAESGPEGRNRDSREFESQLRAMCETLGWQVLDCNVDLFLNEDERDAAGVDLIIAFRDPQRSHRNLGWFMEGKRHDGPGRYSSALMTAEIQRLREKISALSGRRRFTEHERIRPHIDDLIGGVLVHHSSNYEPVRTRHALEGMGLHKFEMGTEPLRIAYLGPDTLNGLAEAFDGTGDPDKYLWPVTASRDQKWSPVCPPAQLAAGLLAYRTADRKTVLWLRDSLEHADIPALARLTRVWGLSVDTVVVTECSQETLSRLRSYWEEVARDTGKDEGPGRLPEDVRALDLSNANMREFTKRWPVSVA